MYISVHLPYFIVALSFEEKNMLRAAEYGGVHVGVRIHDGVQ